MGGRQGFEADSLMTTRASMQRDPLLRHHHDGAHVLNGGVPPFIWLRGQNCASSRSLGHAAQRAGVITAAAASVVGRVLITFELLAYVL